MKLRKDDEYLYVSFNYDARTVQKVKSFEGRKYNPENKEWSIPIRHEAAFREMFEKQLNFYDIGEPINLSPIVVKQNFGEIPSDYKFKVEPMSHQLKAIEYGLANDKWVLGDEMGCGKTYESLIVADILKQTKNVKHCLIVCGINSLKLNWKSEIEKYTYQEAKILGQKINRNGRLVIGSTKDKLNDVKNIPDTEEYYIITNIESLRTETIADELAALCASDEIGMVIVDEVHKCTNFTSKQTKGLTKLDSKYKIAMSGTPLLNNPIDLYSILFWLNKENCTLWQFKNIYCVFERCRLRGGRKFNKLVGYKNLEQLQEKLAKSMLRRKKEEVLDLPDKIYINEVLEMEDDQLKLYDRYAILTKELIEKEKTLANALAQLTKLREITSNSSHIEAGCSTAKLDRMEEIVSEAVQNGESVVIFSNWVSVVKEAEKRLKKFGVVSIIGEKDETQRRNAELTFQSGEAKVMIGTIKAIGTGYNLTKGTVEIFIDEPWTMADKEQATDRCHRIGQSSKVVIYSLYTKDTVDEKVHQLLMNKKDLSAALVDSSDIMKLL